MSEMEGNGGSSGASHESSSGSFDSGSSPASTQTAESSGHKPGSAASIRPVPGQPPRSPQQDGNGEAKPESRYERTKRERKEWKERADAREAALAQREQQIAQQQAAFEESKKPKRNYTLDELKHYRNEWAKEAEAGYEGREELVRRADAEIAAMESEFQKMQLPKRGTQEYVKIWHQSEAEIRKEDPDFGIQGTPIDQKVRAVLTGPNAQLYWDHPYGIYAAYAEAQKELLKERNAAQQNEIKTLKEELQRVTGLTSISGGVPNRMGGGEQKDFAKLSSADMRKRLLAGRARPDNSLPWL